MDIAVGNLDRMAADRVVDMAAGSDHKVADRAADRVAVDSDKVDAEPAHAVVERTAEVVPVVVVPVVASSAE